MHALIELMISSNELMIPTTELYALQIMFIFRTVTYSCVIELENLQLNEISMVFAFSPASET
jgi:hypothetical protein